MPDSADPVAAALAAIEDRRCTAVGDRGEPWEHLGAMVTVLEQDVPRLLAVAAALLDGHKPEPLYIPADACGHDGDHDSHFESGDGEMLCGDSQDGFACQWCRENLIDQSEADWPCPVYVGAFEALTGEKVTGDE